MGMHWQPLVETPENLVNLKVLILGHRAQSVGRKYYDEIVTDTKKDAELLDKAFGIFFPEKQPETDP